MSDLAASTPAELLRALAVFAEPPSPEHIRLADLVGLGGVPEASAYSDIFLFQLYPYASVHLGAEGMMGGEARERVAGFWSAVGQVPPTEPDHLSALLGLYTSLSERARERTDAEGVLMDGGRAALLQEHIAPWAFPFLGRVRELAGGIYAKWAELLEEALRGEVATVAEVGATPVLPLHLRLAPPLPDPREDGAGAFLDGVLAPVRSGMIVTRADLARFAGELQLGLRAGERHYALEHLLGQDPVSVLSALAQEARRQGAGHEARRAWLGDTSAFLSARAVAAAGLFEGLAADGGVRLEVTRTTGREYTAASARPPPPAPVEPRAPR